MHHHVHRVHNLVQYLVRDHSHPNLTVVIDEASRRPSNSKLAVPHLALCHDHLIPVPFLVLNHLLSLIVDSVETLKRPLN